MKNQLINYILNQKIVNLNVVNSLVDDSSFSNNISIFWNGETEGLYRPKITWIDEETGENEEIPLNFYKISDTVFRNSADFLKTTLFFKDEEIDDKELYTIFGFSEIDKFLTLIKDINNENNFLIIFGNSFGVAIINTPGTCRFSLPVDEDTTDFLDVVFEETGFYSGIDISENTKSYLYLITNEI